MTTYGYTMQDGSDGSTGLSPQTQIQTTPKGSGGGRLPAHDKEVNTHKTKPKAQWLSMALHWSLTQKKHACKDSR
eukprot:m.103130 g.103130  ORF g.103130 m.103130 type:complete len:75 (+) comp15033_c0_seq1:78-302(+)